MLALIENKKQSKLYIYTLLRYQFSLIREVCRYITSLYYIMHIIAAYKMKISNMFNMTDNL